MTTIAAMLPFDRMRDACLDAFTIVPDFAANSDLPMHDCGQEQIAK